MIMAYEIGSVTRDTFPSTSYGRRDETAITRRIVTGGASLNSMDLPCANEWSGNRGVTADTVGSKWGRRQVFLHLVGMGMVVAVEIARMAISTAATTATIDHSITVATGANDP